MTPPKTPDPDLFDPAPEWSHTILAEDVTAEARLSVEIAANAKALAALARRMDVPHIRSARAALTCTREGAAVHVTGTLEATVVQLCVVTLEPVESAVSEGIDAWFADASAAVPLARARRDRVAERAGKEYRMLEEADDPEPLDDEGRIDLGEVAAQALALGLPEYPRSPNAPEAAQKEAAPPPVVDNPFAQLAAWREEQNR